MKPVRFKQANRKLLAPEGLKDCKDLYVFTDEKVCVSLWKFSFWERLLILFRGKIWLGIISGKSQPPVWFDLQRNLFVEKIKEDGTS